MRRTRATFDAWDTNGDGMLSFEEVDVLSASVQASLGHFPLQPV